MLENILQYFKYYPQFNVALGAGILIFARFFGFIYSAPLLSRKEVPFLIKMPFVLIMTNVFLGILHPKAPPPDTSLILCLVLNITFGLLIGFVASLIFEAITAAGDMMNMQMGLNASSIFDPSTKEQTSSLGRFFGLFGLIIFIHIGGIYWLIEAFQRGFDVFPLYNTVIPLDKIVNLDYITMLSSNVLFFGIQVASPVLLTTLGMDVILGIISKTAPQVNVFQLSFLFKPVIGIAILLITMHLLVNVINDYFVYYAQIY